jgi:hypothetical protein
MPNPKYYKDKQRIKVEILNEDEIIYIEKPMIDERLGTILIGCGRCSECRKLKANGWKIRLFEELKTRNYGLFVTLTISNEEGKKIAEELKTNDSEIIGKELIKRFLDRWRKAFGHAPRHFFVSELGHHATYIREGRIKETTQRLHFHGIIFENIEKFRKLTWVNQLNRKMGRKSNTLDKIWKYGSTNVGYTETNQKIISYVIKYMTKIDEEHQGYYGKIYCSKGLGKEYINKAKKRHEFKGKETITKYKQENGYEISLPQYYKRALFEDEIREILRLYYEDENVTYVRGTPISNDKPEEIRKAQEQALKEQIEKKLLQDIKQKYEWIYGKKIPKITMKEIEKQIIEELINEKPKNANGSQSKASQKATKI